MRAPRSAPGLGEFGIAAQDAVIAAQNAAIAAEARVRDIYTRKHTSPFMAEMGRSMELWLRNWHGKTWQCRVFASDTGWQDPL